MVSKRDVREKYVECQGCQEWRWVKTTISNTTCPTCSKTAILSTQQMLGIRPMAKLEADLIKKFLKKNKPSVQVAVQHHNERPTDFGVVYCSGRR